MAVVYGSWTMDRLESLGIRPSTAPGVVPGLLGMPSSFGRTCSARCGCGRSGGRRRAAPSSGAAAAPGAGRVRLESARGAFCLSLGLRPARGGLPFWPLTAALLFLHFVLLETGDVPARPTLAPPAVAAVIAPVVATVVTLVFQYVFLVRLP